LNGATSGTIRGSIIVDRRSQLTKNGSVNLYFEVLDEYDNPAGLEFGDSGKVLTLIPDSYEEL
jgi:hypothetical protein